jgi:hypothetical protein
MSAFQRRSALVGSGATPHNRIPKPFPAPCQPPATRVPGNGSTQPQTTDACDHERSKHWRTANSCPGGGVI